MGDRRDGLRWGRVSSSRGAGEVPRREGGLQSLLGKGVVCKESSEFPKWPLLCFALVCFVFFLVEI